MQLCIIALVFAAAGCDPAMNFSTVVLPAKGKRVEDGYGYYQTKIKISTAAEVINVLYLPKHEMHSQSENVIASYGENKKASKRWFKMVVFGEEDLTAQRKYFFLEDERPKNIFIEPWEGFRFDCEIVVDSKILEEPYVNENALRLAVLKHVQETLRKDMIEVGLDNNRLDIAGMMVNQALEAVLVKLDSSPVLAAKLSDKKWLKFGHLEFKKAKARMVINDDRAVVNLRVGSFAR